MFYRVEISCRLVSRIHSTARMFTTDGICGSISRRGSTGLPSPLRRRRHSTQGFAILPPPTKDPPRRLQTLREAPHSQTSQQEPPTAVAGTAPLETSRHASRFPASSRRRVRPRGIPGVEERLPRGLGMVAVRSLPRGARERVRLPRRESCADACNQAPPHRSVNVRACHAVGAAPDSRTLRSVIPRAYDIQRRWRISSRG